jgi:hypothetical protein
MIEMDDGVPLRGDRAERGAELVQAGTSGGLAVTISPD